MASSRLVSRHKVVSSNRSEFFSEKGAVLGELSCVALLYLSRVSEFIMTVHVQCRLVHRTVFFMEWRCTYMYIYYIRTCIYKATNRQIIYTYMYIYIHIYIHIQCMLVGMYNVHVSIICTCTSMNLSKATCCSLACLKPLTISLRCEKCLMSSLSASAEREA